MEYINSGKTTTLSKIKDAKERKQKACNAVHPLLKQCRPVFRDIETSKKKEDWQCSNALEADAALIVRFLAHKGIE
jgi:hypothetical protein